MLNVCLVVFLLLFGFIFIIIFNSIAKDKYIETEPFHLPVGISLKGLTRKFKDKAVVDNLSLNFFEGQKTALLGHNGAGKSTTM